MVIANEASARCNGDPAPAWITAVVTTRAKALTSATPGDFVPGSAHVKVFLVTMRGHFAARNATGAKAPAGRYLSLVIDAKTFQGLDFGLGPEPPPVSPASLGPVTYLTGRGHDRGPRVATLRHRPPTRFCARAALWGWWPRSSGWLPSPKIDLRDSRE